MTEQKEVETIPVATRITKVMHDAMNKVLLTNAHLNTADYVRDLIRRDLEARGAFQEKPKE